MTGAPLPPAGRCFSDGLRICSGRGRPLSADKGSTSDLLARQWPTCPARSPDRAAPSTPQWGGRCPPRAVRALPFGRVAHLSRQGSRPYPRIRAAPLTYWPEPGRCLLGRALSWPFRRAMAGMFWAGAYPRIRAILLTYWPEPGGAFGRRCANMRELSTSGCASPECAATSGGAY